MASLEQHGLSSYFKTLVSGPAGNQTLDLPLYCPAPHQLIKPGALLGHTYMNPVEIKTPLHP